MGDMVRLASKKATLVAMWRVGCKRQEQRQADERKQRERGQGGGRRGGGLGALGEKAQRTS